MPRRYLRRNTASHIRSVNTGGAEFCRGPGTRAVGASQDPGLDDRRGLFSSCFVHTYSYGHVAYERYGVAFLLPKRTMTANPKTCECNRGWRRPRGRTLSRWTTRSKQVGQGSKREEKLGRLSFQSQLCIRVIWTASAEEACSASRIKARLMLHSVAIDH
jgi:hypothetical protein